MNEKLDYFLAGILVEFFRYTKWFWVIVALPYLWFVSIRDKTSFLYEVEFFIDCFNYGD